MGIADLMNLFGIVQSVAMEPRERRNAWSVRRVAEVLVSGVDVYRAPDRVSKKRFGD